MYGDCQVMQQSSSPVMMGGGVGVGSGNLGMPMSMNMSMSVSMLGSFAKTSPI